MWGSYRISKQVLALAKCVESPNKTIDLLLPAYSPLGRGYYTSKSCLPHKMRKGKLVAVTPAMTITPYEYSRTDLRGLREILYCWLTSTSKSQITDLAVDTPALMILTAQSVEAILHNWKREAPTVVTAYISKYQHLIKYLLIELLREGMTVSQDLSAMNFYQLTIAMIAEIDKILRQHKKDLEEGKVHD